MSFVRALPLLILFAITACATGPVEPVTPNVDTLGSDAYRDEAFRSLETGINQGQPAKLQQAATMFSTLASAEKRDDDPADWVNLKRNEGVAYDRLADITGDVSFYTKSIDAYDAALGESRLEDTAKSQSLTLNNKGATLTSLGTKTREQDMLINAVDALEQALELATDRDDMRGHVQVVLNNLGETYRNLGLLTQQRTYMTQSVDTLRKAIDLASTQAPDLRARAEHNLGDTLLIMGAAEQNAGILEQAKTAFTDALTHLAPADEALRPVIQNKLDQTKQQLANAT